MNYYRTEARLYCNLKYLNDNMLKLIILSIWFCCGLCDDPIITLPNGKIRGTSVVTVRDNITMYAYMGIPFAAPPVGNLRFQPPQAALNWEGVRDVTKYSTACYQITTNTVHGQSEDCLHINVYTSAEPGTTDKKMPVLVGIYGGGFTHGSATGNTLSPQWRIQNGIVSVSFNYRLGPFGFLSTNDTVLPGNMGLKDQLAALKWVNENIHLFGGDPEQITIEGQSAGSASVTYHILSPQSAGLFRAGIATSGSAISIWAYQAGAKDVAYGIASLIDSDFTTDKSSEELLAFLQSVDAEAIHQTQSKYLVFAPVIEPEHDGAFITQSMYQLVNDGQFNKVPLLAGIMSEEEISKAGSLDSFKTRMTYYDHDIARITPGGMHITDHEIKKEVGTKIRNIYTDQLLEDDLGAGIRWMSDDEFSRANIRYSQLQAQYTDVWFYQFSYHGQMGRNDNSYPGCGRVEHGEDSRYLSTPTDLSIYPEADITTMYRYQALQANFVKYLNPMPEISDLFQNLSWPKVSNDHYYYLDIDTDLSIKENPKAEYFSKWVELFDTYTQEQLITY